MLTNIAIAFAVGMAFSSQNELAIWSLIMISAYKIACLVVGLGFGYMGYHLFIVGVRKPAGDLEASAGNRSLKLIRTSPGTFFSLFGAAVITFTIIQGFNVELPGTGVGSAPLPPSTPMEKDAPHQ